MIRSTILLGVCGALLITAQQPAITNADLRQASAANGVEPAIRSIAANAKGPLWIGFAVPAVPGEHNACCWNDNGRGCGLEGSRNAQVVGGAATPTPVRLEGPSHVVILMRYDGGAPDKLRVLSPDCPLDAGGLPFHWISGVRTSDSLAALAAWVTREQVRTARNRPSDAALHAIAMHAGPEAQTMLVRFADPSQMESIRKSALFWLANTRGKDGYDVVSRVAREDPSDKIREHAIFALTQSRQPESIAAIVRIAKEDRAPRVRGQALFWLSQKASKQSAAAIADAAQSDPDTEVKKKAVFALSQLPKDEGIPRLIQIARNHSNVAVRKQAMFWLGQSQDRRAVEFFEQVLTK